MSIFIFIALLIIHALLTRYYFIKTGARFIKTGAVIKPFLAGLCVLFFGFLFTALIFDVFSSTEAEMFTFLNCIIPAYMDSTRDLVCTTFDIISPITTSLLLICIAALYYTVQFTNEDISKFSLYLASIFLSGTYFIFAKGSISIFIAYELLLLPSCLMIDRFSKTARGKEAAYFMIAWTQIGAVSLFFILIMIDVNYSTYTLIGSSIFFSRSQKNIIVSLAFFGFGTKMPIWPFYW